MAAIVILGTIIRPVMTGYLSILLVGVFTIVYWRTRSWPDRIFYLVCSGTLLVAVCAAAVVWEGLIIAWLVAGVIATVMKVTLTAKDLPALLAACSVTAIISLMIDRANHVLLPLAILCGIAASVFAVMSIRAYRFRKQYAGDSV